METVFVGLSGGVDSAVSAALLKERGFRVVGCFIKIWQPSFLECTWREDRLDAMRVCAALSIPFREVDLSEEYLRDVVNPMIAQYAAGITPNPDVLCNERVKFGHFARWAFAAGADRIATGHYARTDVRNQNPVLLRAADTAKDQSYFLYRIEPSTLARTFFPIGHLRKNEVRAHAERLASPVAQKPDSQGLCFVGEVSMRDFLKRFTRVEPGAVMDMQGREIGMHEGALLYTIGQRHGFRARGGVQYVVSVDVKRNTITVSGNQADCLALGAVVEKMHWIHSVPLPLSCDAQARYHEKPVCVSLSEKDENGAVDAVFAEPHLVSSGQSLVFYQDDECLGGGIIGGRK